MRWAKSIGVIGENRTVGYAKYGAAGMLTLFIRGMLCNWMVSTGVVGAMISTTVSGKVIAMWMPIMVFFLYDLRAFHREHVFVSFRVAVGRRHFSTFMDYLIWNEIPTVVGNLVGGLAFTGLTLVCHACQNRRPSARHRRSVRINKKSRSLILRSRWVSSIRGAGACSR